MMWKNNLCNSTQIPAILRRIVNTGESCSSIVDYHCCSRSICSNSPESLSRFSSYSSASYFIDRHEGKSFPSAKQVFFSNPKAIFFAQNGSHFCSQPKSAEKFRCWNCGAEAESATAFLFCQACHSVQPVNESIDYFQIFGLERKYEIEIEELEKRYKEWQKKLHPDLVHSKSQRERDYAAEQSARVIDAYRTLADPLSRAIYSVKLQGVFVDEEERVTDPELLAEIMELRESVEEAEDVKALNKIQAELQEKLQYWSKLFSDAYITKNYEAALDSIRRMTYYKRANEEIVKRL